MASAQGKLGAGSNSFAPGDPRAQLRQGASQLVDGTQSSAGTGNSSSKGPSRVLSVKDCQKGINELHKKTSECARLFADSASMNLTMETLLRAHQLLTRQIATSHILARSIEEWSQLPDGDLKAARAQAQGKLVADHRDAEADVKKTAEKLLEQLTTMERCRLQMNRALISEQSVSSPSTGVAVPSSAATVASGSAVTVAQLNEMKTQLQADFEARLAKQGSQHEAAMEGVRRQHTEDIKAVEVGFARQLLAQEKEMVDCLKKFGTSVKDSYGQRVDSYVVDQIQSARRRLDVDVESLVKKQLLQHANPVPPAPVDQLFDKNGKLTPGALNDVLEQIKARFETSTLARTMVQHAIQNDPSCLADALASPRGTEVLKRAGVLGSRSPEPPSGGGTKRRRTDDGPASSDVTSAAKLEKLVQRLENGQVYNADGVKEEIKEWADTKFATAAKETRKLKEAADDSKQDLQNQLDELELVVTGSDLKITKTRVDRMHKDHGQMTQRVQALWEQHENPPPQDPVNAVTPNQLNHAIQGLRQDVSTSYLTTARAAALHPSLEEFQNLNDIVGAELDNGEAYRSRVLRALGLSTNAAGEGDEAAREEFFERQSWWLDKHLALRPSLAKHVIRLLLRSFKMPVGEGEGEGEGEVDMNIDRHDSAPWTPGAAAGRGGHGKAEDAELTQLLRDLSRALGTRIDASAVYEKLEANFERLRDLLTQLFGHEEDEEGQEGGEEEEKDELEGDGPEGRSGLGSQGPEGRA